MLRRHAWLLVAVPGGILNTLPTGTSRLKWLAVQDKLEAFRLREPDLKDQVWACSEGFVQYRTQSPGADLKVHEYIDWVVSNSPCCFSSSSNNRSPSSFEVLRITRIVTVVGYPKGPRTQIIGF